jgi:hypothetical protein
LTPNQILFVAVVCSADLDISNDEKLLKRSACRHQNKQFAAAIRPALRAPASGLNWRRSKSLAIFQSACAPFGPFRAAGLRHRPIWGSARAPIDPDRVDSPLIFVSVLALSPWF